MRKICILTIVSILMSSTIVFAQADTQLSPPMVPILEYHNFGETEGRWTRTYDNFHDDLLWLYNNDFRPVGLSEFMSMEFELKDGMRPVILTFDDASSTQFKLDEEDVLEYQSAVGVMEKFALEYPDFGRGGTFFVIPQGFAQPDKIKQKFEFLIESGYEIENHTFGHEDLSSLEPAAIKQTLAQGNNFIKEHAGKDARFLSYPFGSYMEPEIIELVKEGEFEGSTYKIEAGFLVGAEPAFLPDHPDFDPYLIPRIQAIDDEWQRWFKRESGQIGRSEVEFDFEPYTVGVDYSLPPEPKYPYENCKPFEYEKMSFGEHFWKWARYQKSKIQINKMPDGVTYKDGKFLYNVTGKNDLEAYKIAEKLFAHSGHYRFKDFSDAIVAANSKAVYEKDEEIVVPDIPLLLFKFPAGMDNLWGIYLTSYYAVADEGKRLIGSLKGRGGRLVIFDVKEIDGHVYYPTGAELAHETGAQRVVIPSLHNFVRYWHEQDIYLAARLVVFKDMNLANSRRDLAIQSRTGGVWAGGGVAWLDASNVETQDYILDLVEELAKSGIDEIQFDYIRFPTQGNVSNTKYNFDEVNIEKYEVIRDFVARAHDRLSPYETKLAMDVYGVIVWNNGYDSHSVGQRMECLGPYIDVVYPMIYPSHFGPGFAGYSKPGDHPYYFVQESLSLFKAALEGTNTEIRPWLQAFAWRVSNYGWWYVEEQVKATNDEGIEGYALWNARNVYF